MAEHKPPHYTKWIKGVNKDRKALVSDTAAEVASNLLDINAAYKATGGNFPDMDQWIDAQLDRLIAVCGGNIRLALFQSMIGMGFALDTLAKYIAANADQPREGE